MAEKITELPEITPGTIDSVIKYYEQNHGFSGLMDPEHIDYIVASAKKFQLKYPNSVMALYNATTGASWTYAALAIAGELPGIDEETSRTIEMEAQADFLGYSYRQWSRLKGANDNPHQNSHKGKRHLQAMLEGIMANSPPEDAIFIRMGAMWAYRTFELQVERNRDNLAVA